MKPIRHAALSSTTPRGVLLDCGDGITCRISALRPDLVRVLFLRHGVALQPNTWMVPAPDAADVPWEGRDRRDESGWPTPSVRVEEADSTIRIATDALTLTVGLSPFALTWALPDGRVFAADRPAHAYSFGHAKPGLRHAFARHEDDRYYGLGDKTGKMNLAGRRLRTTMMDSLGFDPVHGDPLYKHWPFLIARDGATGTAYGVLYDNMPAATFDLGCEHDNYYGPYRTYETDGGDLDYYLFVGPAVLDVTRTFLDLTGRPALPPRWTLGYAQTAMAIADSDNAQERIEQFIDTCATEAIPVSAFHFGSGYTTIGPRRYVFNWNHQKFPDPERLMRRFHDAGMHIVANLKPCLLDDHPRYDEPRASGAFVHESGGGPAVSQFWDGEGAHLDFTNPAGIAWWQAGLREQVLATGIDVAWNDNNEYGFWNEDALCDGFGTPTPLDLLRPVQPLLMTRASLEEQRRHNPEERQFTVTRAGCPGIQRYAQTWSGDNATSWESLKWNLRTGLGMSLSGMVNIGHDVGGFSGPVPGPELLIRWTQMGSVHPRFIMNSWKPDGVYTSPWLHAEATPLIREAIRLRYRLMPYLYSLMHDATAHGTPPLRPPLAVFDGCAEGDDLMVGPSLLACPVVSEGAREVVASLPAGPECWFDFWTEARHEAGSSVTLAAPLGRLPLLCPAGAIVPMTDAPDDFSRLHDEPSRFVRLFPGHGTGSGRFVLTEDDGIGAAGPATRVAFELSWTPETVRLSVATQGDFKLPYETITVALPRADQRKLDLHSAETAPRLAAGALRLPGLS